MQAEKVTRAVFMQLSQQHFERTRRLSNRLEILQNLFRQCWVAGVNPRTFHSYISALPLLFCIGLILLGIYMIVKPSAMIDMNELSPQMLCAIQVLGVVVCYFSYSVARELYLNIRYGSNVFHLYHQLIASGIQAAGEVHRVEELGQTTIISYEFIDYQQNKIAGQYLTRKQGIVLGDIVAVLYLNPHYHILL